MSGFNNLINPNQDEYFTSYEDLQVHQLMLLDKPRQTAYKNAILGNKSLFENKIVLDVGAGSGILSIFCAQAGAKKVFAVEASNIANLAREIIKENKFENIIEVFQSKIEDFYLPDGIESVDIIVSEWMGFYLVHEGMLDSVIFARDTFLKEDGLLFPSTASIFMAPCSIPTQFDDWEELDGVKMSSFADHFRREKANKPDVLVVRPEDLLHSGRVLVWLDLNDVTTDDLREFSSKEVFVVEKQGKYQGVCLWFECKFPASDENEEVVLSTAPNFPATHWKQSVIVLPKIATELVDVNEPIALSLNITRHSLNPRRYDLQFEILGTDDVEHEIPCDCVMTKCILVKAHLAASLEEK